MWQRIVRDIFRKERVPYRFLWWLAADGLDQWYGHLRTGLAEPLGGTAEAEKILSRIAAPVFVRHYDDLRHRYSMLPDRSKKPEIVHRLFLGLHRVSMNRRGAYMFSALNGNPVRLKDSLSFVRSVRKLPVRERWEELTTHLGELLIALTESLPVMGFVQANASIGKICFEMGVDYATRIKNALNLPCTPQSAIEVLRKGEYIFRVNPKHWSNANTENRTGFIEGTACPWYTADGWSMVHCGIFGQFQAGVCSVFGLRYQLTKTIPKNGGHTCRVDLRPSAGNR